MPLNLALVRRRGSGAGTPQVRVDLAKVVPARVTMAINQALRAESSPALAISQARHPSPKGSLRLFPQCLHSRHPGPWLSVMHGIPPKEPSILSHPRDDWQRSRSACALPLFTAAPTFSCIVSQPAVPSAAVRPSSTGIIHRRGSMRLWAVMRRVIRAKGIRRDRGS